MAHAGRCEISDYINVQIQSGACTRHAPDRSSPHLSVLDRHRRTYIHTSPMQVATQASHPSSINDQATQGQTRRDSPARCSLESHTQSHRTPKIALAFMRRCTWWHACPLPRPHPPPPTPCLTRKSRPECDLPHHVARPIWHPLAHPRWINRQSTRSSSGDSTRRESARRGGDQQRDPPR